MASIVYAVWSITNVASMHCAVRPEISPCTCEPIFMANTVNLFCEGVDSFHQIVDALSDKFTPNISISLKISHSQLEDLEMRSFGEMNLNLKKLRLMSNKMRSVPETPFRGLSNIEYLSLAENDLEEIPKHVLNHLPKIKTLDLGRGKIKSVNHDDFKGIPDVNHLILVTNQITRLDQGAFPKNLLTLHIGRNHIETLNGTLRDLSELKSLFINMNNITSLENELPPAPEMILILAQNNRIEKLPQSLKDLPNLESLYFENNQLRAFDGVFQHGRHLQRLYAMNNRIAILAEDEFQEAEMIEELNLAYNNLKSLNKSLLPIAKLRIANFTFNDMEEFSMNEIRGLKYLHTFDVSYNRIKRLTGRQENLIEPNTFVLDLRLNNNLLKSLDGALVGLNKMRTLVLRHNQIERIHPDDFIGLESLELLDISHNQLLSLEETSTTFLPSLKILNAAYNNLTQLERDFHGLPVLCQANMTNNQIISISAELAVKTRCKNHGVPEKLEIWLENNPIMCSDSVRDLCPVMESQEVRLRGRSQLIPNEEICSDRPIILQAPLPLIPQILQAQLQQGANPAIVQVIVPAPLGGGTTVIKAEVAKAIALAPVPSTTTSTTTTTTSTTTEAPVPNTEAALLQSSSPDARTPEPVVETTKPTSSAELAVVSSREPPAVAVDMQTEFDQTIQYSPIVGSSQSASSSSEADDNSVHEEYSPIVLSAADNTQLRLMPEEPPETP